MDQLAFLILFSLLLPPFLPFLLPSFLLSFSSHLSFFPSFQLISTSDNVGKALRGQSSVVWCLVSNTSVSDQYGDLKFRRLNCKRNTGGLWWGKHPLQGYSSFTQALETKAGPGHDKEFSVYTADHIILFLFLFDNKVPVTQFSSEFQMDLWLTYHLS